MHTVVGSRWRTWTGRKPWPSHSTFIEMPLTCLILRTTQNAGRSVACKSGVPPFRLPVIPITRDQVCPGRGSDGRLPGSPGPLGRMLPSRIPFLNPEPIKPSRRGKLDLPSRLLGSKRYISFLRPLRRITRASASVVLLPLNQHPSK